MSPLVIPDWYSGLTLQQQSTLLCALRGPDGIPKSHPCKDVQRAYRGTVVVAAKFGRCLEWGEHGDSFMSLAEFADDELWGLTVMTFFHEIDALPHHFIMHLMHGAQILGYKHPDERIRQRWDHFYATAVKDMHLFREPHEIMDRRLSDWGREHWETEPA